MHTLTLGRPNQSMHIWQVWFCCVVSECDCESFLRMYTADSDLVNVRGRAKLDAGIPLASMPWTKT